jgi:hypothetical protein
MSDSLYLCAVGLVFLAYGVWLYRFPSAERFYAMRPYLLAYSGWVMTGAIPYGVGFVLIGVGALFPNGSIGGQIFVGLGFISCLLGFGLILIHPNRIRPHWLRGKVGD